MMNDQDRDLIAALAEGRLSTTDAGAALARIDADPELSAELASQVSAIDSLGSMPATQMTADERSVLHSNLINQLGLSPSADPAVTARRKTPWWQPVFGLATAAAVVAAIVILPGTLSGTESADVALVAQETQQETVEDAAVGDTFSETSVAESGAAAEAPSADESPLTSDEDLSVFETDSVELEELLSATDGSVGIEDTRQNLAKFGFESTVDLDIVEVNRCIDELETELPEGVSEVLVIGADTEDEATIVHLGFDYGEGVEDGLSFVLDSCSLVRHSSQG